MNLFFNTDLVALPDFAVSAMENWGLVTYRETAMWYDPGNTGSRTLVSVTLVLLHELAHMVIYLVSSNNQPHLIRFISTLCKFISDLIRLICF